MMCICMLYLFTLLLQVQFHLTCQINNSVDPEESVLNKESCNNRNFIMISTIDGMITALDMKTGMKCWSLLLDKEKFISSTLSELEIFENGRQVWLVPSLDGNLFKYDNFKIQPLPVDVNSLISHSSYLDSSTSVIGGKVKVIFGVHRLTGEIIYTCKIEGCNSLKIPFPENLLIVEEIIQFVNAIDSSKAQNKWHFRVVELKVKLASQVPSDSASTIHNKTDENALIPSNFREFISFDMYKVSLQNGFAGMIDKSTQNFSWLFKTSCPITDAWLVNGNIVKVFDPFDKESGFFSVEMGDGKHSALLFLGSYQNQMFIKKSRNFPLKNMSFSSLSTKVLYQSYSFPVCPKSEDLTTLHVPQSHDLIPADIYLNVSEYGSYFYMNFSIAENTTHCIINTSYIIQYDNTVQINYWFGMHAIVLYAILSAVFYAIYHQVQEKIRKEYVNASTSSFELSIPEKKKAIDTNEEFRSRFHQDFELIAILGKGGFGVVMDVKNKIDDCRYAVKRIRIHERLNNFQYEKVLREVKALAKLDHHGIVRYFNAWIEYPPIGWQESKDIEANIGDISKISSSSCSTSSPKQTASPSSQLAQKLNQNPLQCFEGILSDQVNNSYQFSDYSSTSHESSNSSSSSSIIKWQKSNSYSNRKFLDYSKTSCDESPETSENSKNSNNVIFDESLHTGANTNGDICLSGILYSDDHYVKSCDKIKNNSLNFYDSYQKITESDFCDNVNFLFELLKEHADCYTVLKNINKSLVTPIDFEIFNSFCTYFFHDVTISGVHVIERSDWEKFILMYAVSKNKLLLFQQWLICILCAMESSKDFNCNLIITNFCYILWDINERLNNICLENALLTNNKSKLSGKYITQFSLDIVSNNEAKKMKGDVDDQNKTHCENVSLVEEKSAKQVAPGYLYIQMQLCQKESLRDWLNRHTISRDYNRVMEIFCEIVDAVHYVHNCGMMHRDLKPSNIYFSMEGAIKIGDFGLATSSEMQGENIVKCKELSFVHTSDIGTEFYMSPEQKLKQDYDCKTDIYSLGIILFELLVPFKTYSERYQVLSKIRHLEFPEEFQRNFQNESELVQQLLNNNPKNRPSTNEIKQHTLIKSSMLKL